MKLAFGEPAAMDHEAQRAPLDALILEIKQLAKARDGHAQAEALARAVASFEEKSLAARSAALDISIQRAGNEQAQFAWLADVTARLASAVRGVADAAAANDAIPPTVRVRHLAYALLTGGHECKWRQIAGMRSAQPATHLHHQQLARAMADGTADIVVHVYIDGSPRETSVEALYMRALLLERLASGNLNAQQIEILDDWLLAWMHSLIASRKRPEDENALVADLTGSTGFVLDSRDAPAVDTRSRVYLPLKPVMRQLDHATERFHQGLIFPGFGLSMGFRIEEHIGVIDYLSREFELMLARRGAKDPRAAQAGAREAAVFIGMNDIVTRAVQVSDASLLRVADALTAGGKSLFAGTGGFSALDPAMRVLGLNDLSESGAGLIAGPDHADAIQVGDLAAVRLAASAPALIGIVSRKVALPQGRQHLIGVRILTRVARAVTLEYVVEGGGARPPVTAIFVPGEDTLGRGDSLIVSEIVYRAQSAFRVRFGERVFSVSLGRVKRQGRGWKLVGFDVNGAAPETDSRAT